MGPGKVHDCDHDRYLYRDLECGEESVVASHSSSHSKQPDRTVFICHCLSLSRNCDHMSRGHEVQVRQQLVRPNDLKVLATVVETYG